MFVTSGNGDGSHADHGPLGTLIDMLLAEKVGFDFQARPERESAAEQQPEAEPHGV